MKNKTTLILTIILAVLFGIVTSAAANKTADISQGNYESLLVNRLNIQLEKTDFIFENPEKDDILTCTFNIKIEKTEPEFYAYLNSLTISGTDFTSTLFTAGENNGTAIFPLNVTIPSHNEKSTALEWQISFSFVYDGEQTKYTIPVCLDYETGINTEITQRYISSIPLTITIEK